LKTVNAKKNTIIYVERVNYATALELVRA